MPTTRDEILEVALLLSEGDRLAIVDRLLETLPDEWPGLSDSDPLFTEELEQRSGDWEGAIPWSQLKADLLLP